MSRADALKTKLDRAEAKLAKAQAQHDEAREKHRATVRAARDEAAAAQKAWCDAVAAEGLAGRDDAEAIADALGLKSLEED